MSVPKKTKERFLKVVIVGAPSVGKTCLLHTHLTGTYPEEFIPTISDYAPEWHSWEDEENNPFRYQLSFWDTPGEEDYDRIRGLSYPKTDVFLYCFAVDNRSSYNLLRDKFIPQVIEMNQFEKEQRDDGYNESAAHVIVVTKMDLVDQSDERPMIEVDLVISYFSRMVLGQCIPKDLLGLCIQFIEPVFKMDSVFFYNGYTPENPPLIWETSAKESINTGSELTDMLIRSHLSKPPFTTKSKKKKTCVIM